MNFRRRSSTKEFVSRRCFREWQTLPWDKWIPRRDSLNYFICLQCRYRGKCNCQAWSTDHRYLSAPFDDEDDGTVLLHFFGLLGIWPMNLEQKWHVKTWDIKIEAKPCRVSFLLSLHNGSVYGKATCDYLVSCSTMNKASPAPLVWDVHKK